MHKRVTRATWTAARAREGAQALERCPVHGLATGRGGWCVVCFRYWQETLDAPEIEQTPEERLNESAEETDDQFLSRMLGRNVRFPG